MSSISIEKKKIWQTILVIIAPAAIFFLFQCYIQFPAKDIEIKNGIYSILWMEALCLAITLLSGSAKISLALVSALFMILGLAENYVYRFRAFFLTPTDLMSAGTAMNVASNYDFTPPVDVIIITVLFVLLIALIILFSPKISEYEILKDVRIRVAAGVAFLIVFLIMTQFVRNYNTENEMILEISDNAFHSYKNNKKEGAIIRLLYDSGTMFVKKPVGYSKNEETELLADYGGKADETVPPREELPDIIVIMNESFSDPHDVGPLETNVDYMPFIHSLQEGADNTITGLLDVSIQGANTPNTEFEFLTGNTLAFLPKGSIPFQQFITKDIDSLPRYLANIGYETIAMHPYHSNGWNRTRAYPFLGFSDMKFLEYFEEKNPEYVRDYISDRSFFHSIEDEVEARNDDGPVFSFNVTMQNNGSYEKEFDNLKKDVTIKADESMPHVAKMETYLNLVKLSDDAFKEMIEYYSNVDRKTLLVFFGDHQPATVNFEPVFHNMGTDRRNLSEQTEWDIYKVPFVIWANYDIEEEKGLEMSVNYLGNLVLNTAGIPLDGYRSFLSEYSKKVPVISAIRTVDSEGNSENLSETGLDLSEYEKMQYYELFDRKIEQ